MVRPFAAMLLACAVWSMVGCSAPSDSTPAPPAIPTIHGSIFDGSRSPPSQNFALLFANTIEGGACTGVLIAPNLLLTAYHCVAPQDETNLWGACPVEGEEHPTYVYRYGAPYHPSHFTFWPNQDAKAFDAMAVEIVVPSMEDPCGKDIAAIVLDRPLDSIPLATLREEPAAAGEVMTAVGFGAIDDAYSEPPYRLERNDMRVLAVGPALVPVPVQGDVSAGVPKGDLATTGGICFGDSGGPLLDADGKVVGVASRVASCAEGPAFYTGIAENLTFIAGARAAAKKALETPPDAGPSDAGRPRRDAGKKPDAAPPPEPPAQGDSGCSVSSNVRGSGPEGAAAAGALALAVLLARRARARAS